VLVLQYCVFIRRVVASFEFVAVCRVFWIFASPSEKRKDLVPRARETPVYLDRYRVEIRERERAIERNRES